QQRKQWPTPGPSLVRRAGHGRRRFRRTRRWAMNSPVIRIDDAHKIYNAGEVEVHALRGVSFEVKKGEFVAVMGPSGSGKSTMMNIIGCLDRLTTGRYLLDGIAVSTLSKDQLADIRNQKIGVV